MKNYLLLYILPISMLLLSCKNDRCQYTSIMAPSKPKIDGEIDSVWNLSNFDDIKHIQRGKSYLTNSSDLKSAFGMLWDNHNLYILYKIEDNIVFDTNDINNKNDMPQIFESDCIQLFLKFKKGCFASKKFDYNFELSFGRKNINFNSDSIKDIVIQQKKYDKGYITEISIPWNSVNINPSQTKKFYFETLIWDNDNNSRGDVFKLELCNMNWCEKNELSTAHLNTKNYGEIKLGSLP